MDIPHDPGLAPTPTYFDLNKDQTAELAAFFKFIPGSHGSEPIYGDEVHKDITGVRKELVTPIPQAHVEIARFGSDFEVQARLIPLIKAELNLPPSQERQITHASGHIQFALSLRDARVAGALYLLLEHEYPYGNTDTIRGNVECVVDENDVFSEESEACYDLAEQLGLGVVWTKYLYRQGQEPGRQVTQVGPDNFSPGRLIEYLRQQSR